MEIRPAIPEDFDQVVALSTLVRPYGVGARTWLRRSLTERLGTDRFVGFVAEADGRVAGWAGLTRADHLDTPNAYSLNLLVHPDFRRQGFGTRLLQICDDWLAALPSSFVQSYADGDGKFFALAKGFEATTEMTYAGRELTDAILVPPVPDGYTLVPFAELEAADVFPAYRESTADIPGGPPFEVPFDWFSTELWPGSLLDRELSLALLEGGRVASFTMVNREDTRTWNDMTGTVRDHRGKGLAGFLKLASLSAARDAGVTHSFTLMNLENPPIRALNERLGYREVFRRTYVTRQN
ncbi:GNAT family N-acetyltransferase [Kribbella sp. NPDC006257]|uniref:GNAT family N-acetyltransferase n=1 Tax=Kribbella sp. NPDC006257 TaxID=3156738 RepID=UPI0033AB0375